MAKTPGCKRKEDRKSGLEEPGYAATPLLSSCRCIGILFAILYNSESVIHLNEPSQHQK
jgi:hypothetical protein